jgi:hypothetical protein
MGCLLAGPGSRAEQRRRFMPFGFSEGYLWPAPNREHLAGKFLIWA